MLQKLKQIQKLKLKNHRSESGLFLAETPKVLELLYKSDLKVREIYALPEYVESLDRKILQGAEVFIIGNKDLERFSALKTPNQVMALVEIPEYEEEDFFKGNSLVLDSLRDPGNLGTILRIADWFGINRVLCSPDCADAFQSKCVQASMGSIGHVKIYYKDLEVLLSKKPENFNIYGTFLEGKNIYKTSFSKDAMFIFGNEAHGISRNLIQFINQKILIPKFSSSKNTGAESLNASIAAAIVCSEIKRR